MPTLTDVSVEVLLDNLLPSIPIPDLLSLSSTNRFFTSLCTDDTFWKRKLQADFNFSSEGTARQSGWKQIYRGLKNPKVFTWGENTHGRLGLGNSQGVGDVAAPTEVKIPGARIVGLVSGGMSFHALDSLGDVYVWGSLDPTVMALNSDGFSERGKTTSTPLKLEMPASTRSISCGRLHSMTLDANKNVWTFLSWGRPFRLASPLLDCTSPSSTPLQVECGWAFSAVLTRAGEVYVWWPFGGEFSAFIEQRNAEMDVEGDKRASSTPEGTIPCVKWELSANPFRLPALPVLPPILYGEEEETETILVKIAAMDNNLIGLTNKGHVLKHGMLSGETEFSQGSWEYLPLFSETDKVRAHPAFSSQDEDSKVLLTPPRTMHITHISAHFQKFFAYSTGESSIVLTGTTETTPASSPTIIPALQNNSVISVVLGDYHQGALTSTGELLTWGSYSRGALGLGLPTKIPAGEPGGYGTERQRQQVLDDPFARRLTPPDVRDPTPVRFDHGKRRRKDMFCFGAAAAGWHMGALVLDLEPNVEGGEDDEIPPVPGSFPEGRETINAPPPHEMLGPGNLGPFTPFFRGGGVFRVGFAGRGRGRGNGRGGGA